MSGTELEEALAKVDWDRLRHAYGSASDIPRLIRARASRDERSVREASDALWSTVWHQGTVYEATAPVVPVLAALAADPATFDRAGLIQLLAEISRGRSYIEVHGRGGDLRDLEQERAWVRESRAAVVTVAPMLLSRFDAEPPPERTTLVLLACAVPEVGVRHIGALIARHDTARTIAERDLLSRAVTFLGQQGGQPERAMTDDAWDELVDAAGQVDTSADAGRPGA